MHKYELQIRLCFQLAFRNLRAHGTKTTVVVTLLAMAMLLTVTGLALLDNIESKISQTVIESISGHIQIYDKDARDVLALYGDGSGSLPEVGEIASFKTLETALADYDEIGALIPMGINVASMSRGNVLELKLNEWAKHMFTGSLEKRRADVADIKTLVDDLAVDLTHQRALAAAERQVQLDIVLRDIQQLEDEQLWQNGHQQPTKLLERLETKIAPFAGDAKVVFLRYLGTDLTSYFNHFSRFQLVQGERVPPGAQGILINQAFADRRLKLLAARLFDQLFEMRIEQALEWQDAAVTSKAKRLASQSSALYRVIPVEKRAEIEGLLTKNLASCAGELNELLVCLLAVTPKNFERHHQVFYSAVAPRIPLYAFRIGEEVTLRGTSKAGFPKALNLKVWGTFSFRGLESEMLSGVANLVDMDSFRYLYGATTVAQRDEMDAMRKASGAVDIRRDAAEAFLFGDAPAAEPKPSTERQAPQERDLAKNAAVILKNPERIKETVEKLNQFFRKESLPFQAIDWKSASGLLGQLAALSRVILWVALTIIFAVSIVIINNAMMMATLERIAEFGTLRAIGGQRSLIFRMLIFESLMTVLVATLVGGTIATLSFAYFQSSGIPAGNEIARFLFSGSRLYPTLGSAHLLSGALTALFIGMFATIYPAFIALNTSPLSAMTGAER